MINKISVLSLSYSRSLVNEEEKEKGETLDRIKYYAKFLDKLFILVFSLKEHSVSEKTIKNVRMIPCNGVNRLDALCKIYALGKGICDKHEINIIQAQDPLFTGFVGYLLKRKFNLPLNICVYGPDPYDKRWLLENKTNFILAPLARYVLKNSDGVQADGKKIAINLQKRLNSPRVFYKPMVPKRILDFKHADGKNIKKKLLKNKEEKMLLFIGRLVSQKNIPFLLRCFQVVLNYFPKTRLVIIGEGEEKKGLEELAGKLNIKDKIIWIRRVAYSEIPKYFQAADVFVLPSLYEGFPRVLMEAAMAGLPLVSTDVGGTEDIISHGENGFVISQGNKEEFVNKIVFLLKNSKKAIRMGKKGQEMMERSFDPEKTRYKQIEIWRDILNKK